MSAETWVAVEDVARHVGVSRDTVNRWNDSANVTTHKLRRMLTLKRSEVDGGGRAQNADDDKGA